MKILPALFFAVTFFSAAAQSPQVPHKLNFAGMTLSIRDDARREIQKDVDALTRSPKHFMIKAEKAKTYFPIIEKVFADEGVPDDFKYLVLQESSLIADAVSTSNAVGFWQFKDFTAMEMGLRVDKEIDERMNIASATRGAARYLKKSNSIFDNWLYTLQSYQMGAGAVMRSGNDLQPGAKHMEITSNTYWYVKKFLAYKVAYEQAVEGEPELRITVLENKSKKTVADLARELSIDETELRNYNKWIRNDKIPDDRIYVVVVPGSTGVSFETLPSVLSAAKAPVEKPQEVVAIPVSEQTALLVKINGVNAVQALPGEDVIKITQRVNVDLVRFLEWNEISKTTAIVPGVFYFLGKKRAKGDEDYHTVVAGETLWSVSQKYGIRLKKLKKYNRSEDGTLIPGSTVWLSSMKPKEVANSVVTGPVAVLDHQDTFEWEEPKQADTAQAEEVKVVVSESVQIVTLDTLKPIAPADSLKNLQLTQEPAILNPTGSSTEIVVIEPSAGKSEHVVQPKETLYAIAKIYNVGVMDLVNWNGLDLQQGIKIGQVLRVAPPEIIAEGVKSSEVFHEVVASDTLYSIARKYGVTIKDLMDWNEKKDFAIAPGEKLKIKQGQ